MAQLTFSAPRGRTSRLIAFALETHPPAVYALVSWGWAYSLIALLCGGAPLPAATPWLGLVFFLVLLYLRAIDEIKDLPHDRIHHPERPVVRGAVSVPEVAAFAALIAGLVVALCTWLSPWMGLFAAGQLAYGLGLLVLERRWARMRQSVMLNLAVTVPVSIALNGLVLVWLHAHGIATRDVGWAVLAHVAVFLHMEFGRKLVWMRALLADEPSYARTLGPLGAATVCLLLGGVACAVASWVLTRHGAGALASLPWLAMLPSYVGFRLFMANRHATTPAPLKPWFGGAMVLFFLLNAGNGAFIRP